MQSQARMAYSVFTLASLLTGFSAPQNKDKDSAFAPGHQLQILSKQDPSLMALVEISWEGDAQLPLCGKWRLVGMSPSEVGLKFGRCLTAFYKSVPDVVILNVNPEQVAVRAGKRGETLSTLKIHANHSIPSVLASAGLSDGPESQVRILTPYGLDLVVLPSEYLQHRSFRWRGGETILVEPVRDERDAGHVDVLGEVRRPGRIRYRPLLTVFDVFRDVQGSTPQAVENKIVLIRATTGEKIETTWNDSTLRLEPGDALWVPAQRESSWEKGVRVGNSFLSLFNALLLVALTQRKSIP